MLNSIQTNSGYSLPFSDVAGFISIILPYIFGVAGIILLFMLITAGYQIIFSRGDPKAMQIAQSKITTSLIGILILFASFWIVRIIMQFLGIDSTLQLFN